MSFIDMRIEMQYRSDENNSIVNEFFIPTLKQTKVYKRSVGFFTSTALIEIAEGLSGLIKNNGKMYLVVSPKLTQEDIKAIELGYRLKEEVIEETFINELNKEFNKYEKERLNYLAFLIYKNLLEIKVAIMKDYGIYHEKIGIMEDQEGNKLAFTGSLNETQNAFRRNFESIDVYKSWREGERVKIKDMDFNRLWNNETSMLEVIAFSKAVEKKILEYKRDDYIMEKVKRKNIEGENNINDNIIIPSCINGKPFQLRPYQLKAIENWKKNKYKGLLAMATGTGKTLTALAAVERLWREKGEKLAIIIVCPYTHLVEQWVEDVKNFNIKPIVAYGNTKWKNKLKINIGSYNYDIINYFCVITTNATYQSRDFQTILLEVQSNVLFIVDEAHNFGSQSLSKLMHERFEYRLALSATPKRYFDEDGTQKLFKYFDKQVFEFTLKDAIRQEYLTTYYYYPNIVYLNEKEYEEYKEISKKISVVVGRNGELDIKDETIEMLLLKRARIINLAENKILVLKKLMYNYKNTYNNIIYCASGKINEGKKQIDEICEILGHEMNMKIHRFTAKETKEERLRLITKFEDRDLQALVAIKCLDEGVNIPCIERAFILASTGNSKEFIQRRGRVLRKYKGKKFAYIYDFIVLPRPIEEIKYEDLNVLRVDLALINKELRRIKEFAELAINRKDPMKIIDDIEVAYGIRY